MQRDMDLMRKILFKIEEEFPAGQLTALGLNVEGYSQAAVASHCQLLFQEGLLNSFWAKPNVNRQVLFFEVGCLTSKGYDFLNEIREDTTWNKTKEVVKKKGLPMVLDVIKVIAATITQAATQAVIKEMTGKP